MCYDWWLFFTTNFLMIVSFHASTILSFLLSASIQCLMRTIRPMFLLLRRHQMWPPTPLHLHGRHLRSRRLPRKCIQSTRLFPVQPAQLARRTLSCDRDLSIDFERMRAVRHIFHLVHLCLLTRGVARGHIILRGFSVYFNAANCLDLVLYDVYRSVVLSLVRRPSPILLTSSLLQ